MVENTEMNAETTASDIQEVVTTTPAPKEKKKVSIGSVLMGLIILGLIALTGAGYFVWDQLKTRQEGIGGDLSKGDQRVIEVLKQVNALQTQLATAEKQLATISQVQSGKDKHYEHLLQEHSKLYQERLQNMQTQLYGKIGRVERQLGKTRGDWLIADAEYLLSVANERLQLSGDVDTTILALEAADQRLRESGDGAVFKIRTQLNKDISALKQTSTPDIVGLLAQIDVLQQQTNQLPLSLPTIQSANIQNQLTESETAPEDLSITDRVLKDFRELVKVRPRDPLGPSSLSLEEARILREDLQLRLEIAKSALVRRTDKEFAAALKSATEWINLHFDTNSPATKLALGKIRTLINTEISSQFPDISSSLKQLRQLNKFRLDTDLKNNETPDKAASPTDEPQANAIISTAPALTQANNAGVAQ